MSTGRVNNNKRYTAETRRSRSSVANGQRSSEANRKRGSGANIQHGSGANRPHSSEANRHYSSESQRRHAAERKKQALLRKKKKRRLMIFLTVDIVIALAIILLLFAMALGLLGSPVEKRVVMELGNEIKTDSFLLKEVKSSGFITDVASIDITKPGTHNIKLQVNGKEYESELVLQDTIAPTATAVAITTPLGVLPNPSDCIENIVDVQAVTVSFEVEPEVRREGAVDAVVRLTDASGNYSLIMVEIVVRIFDEEPPVIEGVADIEITEGDSISYRKDIVVTDNMDENPTLTIDNSQVDPNTPGEYTVTYTATDAEGNSTSVTAKVIVKKAIPADEAEVYELAEAVLESITNDSMSDMEVAFAIYRWTKSHIAYSGDSDKSDWVAGAKQAFTKYSGDCFNYFAAAKALFAVAGIETVDVVKSDTSHSRHYWNLINLGDGWYHVDCTPWVYDNDNLFMVTDDELAAFSSSRRRPSHVFDSSLYPDRATASLQSRIHYGSGTIDPE